MNPVATFISKLSSEGIPLNPGATESELRQLEELLGVPLPDDVREFYQTANGIPEDQLGPHMVGFWSIPRIQKELASWGDGRVGFADVMISSWRFIFQPTQVGLMVFTENVPSGEPLSEIGSFSQFLSAYLDAPESLDLM